MLAAIRDGALVTAALEGTLVVGVALALPASDAARRDLFALGVAPAFRRQGLGTTILAASIAVGRPGDTSHEAEVTLAERDPVEPLDRAVRASIARHLFDRAGFLVSPVGGPAGVADPLAVRATRPA